jgi:phosphate-selective porin OprO/OprP
MRTVFRALIATAVLGATPLRAQEKPVAPTPPPSEPPAAKPEEKKAEEEKSPVSAGPDGFVIQSESGDYRLQIRGYAQFDGRFFEGDEDLAIDTFVLRRVRPILQGTVARHFDFNITPDFGVGTTVLQDAFLDVNYSPKARIRVGKFKPPVGLERLQSATNLAFVERAYPTALVPNRDLGVQIHGELGGGILAYAAGVFDGAPDGGSVDVDLNDGKDLAARVFISPFKRGKSVLKGLGFGIAGTTGEQTGPLPAYRSGGQVSVVTLLAGITADGTRKRYSPQLSFYGGPVGILAEYVHSESRVKKADDTHADFEGEAWQATATVALTGDAASYTGVRPRKPFDPKRGQWGAIELAGRVNGIKLGGSTVADGLVDPTKSVRDAFAWALGVNWYLNRNIKQVVNFERTTFSGGAAAGADRPAENAILIRTQVAF